MCGIDGKPVWGDEDGRSSEQVMVEMMKADLGVTIDPQALRMFLRYRWDRFTPHP
jgi:hypothetical protein